MPRGQRKSLEEKIQAKQELINALNIRIESEERELEELYEQKRRKELEAVSDLIEDAGLAPEEVTEVLQEPQRKCIVRLQVKESLLTLKNRSCTAQKLETESI